MVHQPGHNGPAPGGAPPTDFETAILSAIAQGGGGGMAGASPDDPMVLVGHISKTTYENQPKLAGDSYVDRPITAVRDRKIKKPVSALLHDFDQMSRKDFLKFRNLLIAAGYLPEDASALDVRGAYEGILFDLADMQATSPNLTPAAYINNLIRLNGLDPKKIGSAEDFSTAIKDQVKPSSSTQTSVYDLTPEDARATLEQAMYQKLGRNPTQEEIEDFIAAAQTRAERNPTRVTQSFRPGVAGGEGDQVQVDREGGQVIGTTVTNVDEGFDDESLVRMAERRAMNAPDYGAYQSVSRFFPAFLNALGATSPGV